MTFLFHHNLLTLGRKKYLHIMIFYLKKVGRTCIYSVLAIGKDIKTHIKDNTNLIHQIYHLHIIETNSRH